MIEVVNNKLQVQEEAKNKITKFLQEKVKFEKMIDELKEEALIAMEKYGITGKQDFGDFEITYRKASERATVDSKRLKEELPDIYEDYSKISQIKSSVVISLK